MFFGLFGKTNQLYKKYDGKARNASKKRMREMLKYIENTQQEINNVISYFLAYTEFKQHYGIEIPTEVARYGNKYELVRIKLGDIKREWCDKKEKKIYSLKDVSPYKYLETGDKKIYEQYIKKHIDLDACSENTAWDVKRFDDLFKSVKKYGYDPKKCVICVNENNVILDGQHRACCLLYLHGEEYEINVLKISRI